MWSKVEGYEDLYLVSNLGEVFSIRSNKILKHCVASSGYYCVSLSKDKKVYTKSIHRLVANAFLNKDSNKPVVNHINGNKLDNRLENLEWVTSKENTKHAITSGLMKVKGKDHPMFGKTHKKESKVKMRNAKLGKVGKDHPRSLPVAKCDIISGEILRVYENQSLAAKECGISQGNIGSVLAGNRNHAGGFKWKYI